MRPSNRSRILEAAVAVVQREGVTSLTYEAVAEEAGLTKGGLLYHFPTREALTLGIHEYLAMQWETALLAALGKDFTASTPVERRAAYAQVASASSSRAELLFILEAAGGDPTLFQPFAEVFARWAPDSASGLLSDRELDLFIARLAADGLWLYDSLATTPLAQPLREQIATRIADSIRSSAHL